MSERSREHIHPVMLNATFYVGITKLSASLECSKSAAILFALNEGLMKENVISQEDYELLKQRYGRKLKDVITEAQIKKENSHIPKLELEKKKQEQTQNLIRQEIHADQKEKQVDLTLKGVLEVWTQHDVSWQVKQLNYAKKYPENQYAKQIIAKEKECDIISRPEELKKDAS